MTIACLAFLMPSSAGALTSCKAMIDRKTGAVLISGTGLQAGTLRWGDSPGSESQPFFDADTCAVGGKLEKCHIADPDESSLTANTPPANCRICVSDGDGSSSCCARVWRCTPGTRGCVSVAGEPLEIADGTSGASFVQCPDGFSVTGGGGLHNRLEFTPGDPFPIVTNFRLPLSASLPSQDGRSWECRGGDNDSGAESTLVCWARCCQMPSMPFP